MSVYVDIADAGKLDLSKYSEERKLLFCNLIDAHLRSYQTGYVVGQAPPDTREPGTARTVHRLPAPVKAEIIAQLNLLAACLEHEPETWQEKLSTVSWAVREAFWNAVQYAKLRKRYPHRELYFEYGPDPILRRRRRESLPRGDDLPAAARMLKDEAAFVEKIPSAARGRTPHNSFEQFVVDMCYVYKLFGGHVGYTQDSNLSLYSHRFSGPAVAFVTEAAKLLPELPWPSRPEEYTLQDRIGEIIKDHRLGCSFCNPSPP